MIQSAAVSAVTPIMHGLVMNESFKMFVDEVSNLNLFGVRIDDFASRVGWEHLFEAGGAETVVLA